MKLEQCPFCGSKPVKPHDLNKGSSRRPTWIIHCSQYCITLRRDTKKQVVEDWNRRVSTDRELDLEVQLSWAIDEILRNPKYEDCSRQGVRTMIERESKK